MSKYLKHIKSGFVSGLKSIMNIDLDPPRHTIRARTEKDIHRHWAEVGQLLQDAMYQVEESPEYRRAQKNKERNDAHQLNFFDEQRTDLQHT